MPTQLSLPLADHVLVAKVFKKRIDQTRGEMFICHSKWSDQYYLARRTFDGPEVEWETLHTLADRQQAYEIKVAGVCEDWLDCLSE